MLHLPPRMPSFWGPCCVVTRSQSSQYRYRIDTSVVGSIPQLRFLFGAPRLPTLPPCFSPKSDVLLSQMLFSQLVMRTKLAHLPCPALLPCRHMIQQQSESRRPNVTDDITCHDNMCQKRHHRAFTNIEKSTTNKTLSGSLRLARHWLSLSKIYKYMNPVESFKFSITFAASHNDRWLCFISHQHSLHTHSQGTYLAKEERSIYSG